MGCGKRLTVEEIGSIKCLREEGYSNREIAGRIHRSAKVMNNFVQDIENYRGGIQTATTARERRTILRETSNSTISPINREFYLAKGTEKFILGRYLLSGILLILLSLRPWGVAARPAILENRGAKSHFCDYFIIRARYLYLRACNSLHFLLFMFFCQINSFVVTACRNREFLLFLYFLFFSTPPQR
jgi:hypothetical protein